MNSKLNNLSVPLFRCDDHLCLKLLFETPALQQQYLRPAPYLALYLDLHPRPPPVFVGSKPPSPHVQIEKVAVELRLQIAAPGAYAQ